MGHGSKGRGGASYFSGPNRGEYVAVKKVQPVSVNRPRSRYWAVAGYVDLLERILDHGIGFNPADSIILSRRSKDTSIQVSSEVRELMPRAG